MTDKLTKTVRKARRIGLMNKIDAIKIVREAYPDAGLKGAKDFYEVVTGEWGHVPATSMAACWCVEHWCDRLHCRCPILDEWCPTCDGPLMNPEPSPTRYDSIATPSMTKHIPRWGMPKPRGGCYALK